MPLRTLRFVTLALVLKLLVATAGCSLFADDEEKPPLFAPGQYGGPALPGTEDLINLQLSPDGRRIALIRLRTPTEDFDPVWQLWILDRDGANARLHLYGEEVGTIDWSPDGRTLALSIWRGISTYVYTYEIESGTLRQWSGLPEQLLSGGTASNPQWFEDGRRLLVGVWATAYEQPFKRGLYVIDTQAGTTEGPLVELMQSATLGNHDRYAVGVKFTLEPTGTSSDGNAARYDFATGKWEWITSFTQRQVRDETEPVEASRTSDLVVQSRRVENAWQLFLMRSDGSEVEQITELGGQGPAWSPDGRYVFFRRDVDRGEGGRYVPFVFDVQTRRERPVWPLLPDSVPVFPAIVKPGAQAARR